MAAVTTEQVVDVARKRLTRGRPDRRLVSAREARHDDGSDQRAVAGPARSCATAWSSIVQQTAFSPAVTISVVVRAGSFYEPDHLPGLAWLCSRVIDRGTTTRTAEDIAESLDDRGVTLRISTNRHAMMFSLHLPVRGLSGHARARGRRGAVAGVSGRRGREAARRDDHRDPAGPRQPGHPRRRGAAGAALRREPSVRPAGERDDRDRRAAVRATICWRFIRVTFRPSPRRWSSSATSIRIDAFERIDARVRRMGRAGADGSTRAAGRAVDATSRRVDHSDAGQAADRHRVRLRHDHRSIRRTTATG